MLVSFTQTYSSDRKKLLEVYMRDERLHEFKNLCDLNLYSFHNTHPRIIKWFKDNNPVKNSEILIFNQMTYQETIKKLRVKLKQIGCTHFFFSQDDTFSVNNETVDFHELIDYVKEHNEKFMLTLFVENTHILPTKKPFLIKDTFNIYDFTTEDFDQFWHFAMDDGPYISTIDLFDYIYDDEYFRYPDIWEAELYLRRSFMRGNKKMNRYTINKILFKNYNFIGRFIQKKEEFERELRKRNLL